MIKNVSVMSVRGSETIPPLLTTIYMPSMSVMRANGDPLEGFLSAPHTYGDSYQTFNCFVGETYCVDRH